MNRFNFNTIFLVLFLILIAGSGISGICVQASDGSGESSQNAGLLLSQKESYSPSSLDQLFGIDSSEINSEQVVYRSGWFKADVFALNLEGNGVQHTSSQLLISVCDAFRSANMMAELPVSSVVNPFQTASVASTLDKVGSDGSTVPAYSEHSFSTSYNNFDQLQRSSHHHLTTVLPMSGGMAIGAP